jgi:creatinine amidohydrolase/Fe(II)-dependent formamide hydrolase-like protein
MTVARIFVCALLLFSSGLSLDAQQTPQRGNAPTAGTPAGSPGQRRGRGGPEMNTPRPIAAFDSVWIEELTWMEVRDAMRSGKTNAIIPAGSTEQNGPYVPSGKHVYVLRQTAESIARKLGNALIAPTVPFEPGNFSQSPGTIQLRQETFESFVEDEANSLKTNGFKNIFLIGDSGGDQKGLDNVAKKLTAAWAGSDVRIYYVKEYYDSWQAADGSWDSLGVPKTKDDGIHDDYSVNSIIASGDPEKIRFKERVAADKASINGQTLLPLETTIANGKKLVDLRANITVEAIRKLLQRN